MGASSTKVHTRTHFTTEAPEFTNSNIPIGTDVLTREQLEEKIGQLEEELQRNVSVKNPHPSKEDKS
ncbi:hypothetical protein XENOCAPTIV_026619, partial [Xenoophorus captivus]